MENKNNLNEVKGYELKPSCPCDQCVTETDDCRKLILAGGEHLCAIPKDIDWEQRRYEIAKALFPLRLQILDTTTNHEGFDGEDIEYCIQFAVHCADKLIEKLKK